MIKKLDHVSIMVRDIEKAVELFSTSFGLKPWRRGIVEIPELGLKSVMLPIKGTVEAIELLQPLDTDSPYSRIINNRGEGLYHIGVLVDNIEEEISTLRGNGVMVEDIIDLPNFPIPIKVAWVDTRSAMGAVIELVELLKKE